MKKLLFFLCALLAVTLVSGSAFGEEGSPAGKTRDNIKLSVSAADNGITINIIPSRKDIFNFKKKRSKERVREIPAFVQKKKKAGSSDSDNFRVDEKYIKEKVREINAPREKANDNAAKR